jgi:hypothetical protein
MSGASTQLALALFADDTHRENGVALAPTDLGFKRDNAFVKIVDLSLAGRRLVDVAYFLAAEDAELHKEYRVDLGLFRWLLATTSRNLSHLRKVIREAQKAAIELNEIDADDQAQDWYGSVPLLGPAFVRNGEFIFELSERLQRTIKNPTTFHILSLRYVFKSVHSKVLYDRLLPFIDEGVTPWLDVQTLRDWMECDKKTYDEFKHFRRKVLDVAITEICEVTSLRVEMLTINVPGSKRIGQVRFRLNKPVQPQDEQKLEFIVLRSLYETLRKEFALNQNEFNEILTNRETFTDERIQQAIEYTQHNVLTGKVKLRAGGYFMKALREGYLLGELDKKIHQTAAAASAAKIAADRAAAERAAQMLASATERDRRMAELGWQIYDQLGSSEQAQLMADFAKSPAAKMLARAVNAEPGALREHFSDQRVRSSFGVFVAGWAHQASQAAKNTQSKLL